MEKSKLNNYIQGDKIIWGVILCLVIISLLAVYSAAGAMDLGQKNVNVTSRLFRHGFLMVLALLVTFGVHKIHYRYFQFFASVLVVLAGLLLLVTLILGQTANEATRWLELPGIGLSVQTSDFAKIALVLFVARRLSQGQEREADMQNAFKQIMIATGIICALIFPENFSTAVLLFATVLVMMFIGRMHWRRLFLAAGIAIAGGAVFISVALLSNSEGRVGTWKHRIESYFSPEEHENYQATQAKIAIANGSFMGKGPGNSTQRNFLPQAYSDFIYAIIIEEYGIGGTIVVLLLYMVLLFRGGRIVRKCKRTFPAFIVIGIILIITFQAFVNMAVAVNLFPVTGQTLPMISWGGTSAMFTSVGLGIVLGVSRLQEQQTTKKQQNAMV